MQVEQQSNSYPKNQGKTTRSNGNQPPVPPTWTNPTTKEDKAAYRAEALAYLKEGQKYVETQVSKNQFKSEFSKLNTLEDFEDAFEPIKDEIERLTV